MLKRCTKNYLGRGQNSSCQTEQLTLSNWQRFASLFKSCVKPTKAFNGGLQIARKQKQIFRHVVEFKTLLIYGKVYLLKIDGSWSSLVEGGEGSYLPIWQWGRYEPSPPWMGACCYGCWKICTLWPVWPDWAIYWTLGNFLKPLATIYLPKSLTLFKEQIRALQISIQAELFAHIIEPSYASDSNLFFNASHKSKSGFLFSGSKFSRTVPEKRNGCCGMMVRWRRSSSRFKIFVSTPSIETRPDSISNVLKSRNTDGGIVQYCNYTTCQV